MKQLKRLKKEMKKKLEVLKIRQQCNPKTVHLHTSSGSPKKINYHNHGSETL